MRNLFFIFLFSLAFLFNASTIEAASLNAIPSGQSFLIGDEFFIDIKIDSEGVGINAAEATLQFQNNLIEVIEISRTNSVFNFWIEEPHFSNETGIVSFIGGTPKGVSGESLHILRINVRTVGSGEGEQIITNGVITASDGKGTNVLSSISNAYINVGVEIRPPSAPAFISGEEPRRIIPREAVRVEDLPEAPEVRVSLYPDQEKWYSHVGETIVLWEIPSDVVKVAVDIDHNPNSEPQTVEEELFNGKNFGVIDEGIWYIHVQFKNNIGWGNVAHYRLAIDTTAPLAFEIQTDGDVTGNPTPIIHFDTQDSLSGVSEISIFVDNNDPIISTTTKATLEPLTPGEHTVVVRISDRAGNSVEDDVIFAILPLESPVVSFLTTRIIENEPLFISGKAIPNESVDIKLIDSQDQEVFVVNILTDNLGSWELFIDEQFAGGVYILSVTARDGRGASSYPVLNKIKIKLKPIISLGIIDLSWFEILLVFITFVSGGIGVYAWNYREQQSKRVAYLVIATRDIEKLHNLLLADLEILDDFLKGVVDPEVRNHIEQIVSKMRETLIMMKKHITEEIKKLS